MLLGAVIFFVQQKNERSNYDCLGANPPCGKVFNMCSVAREGEKHLASHVLLRPENESPGREVMRYHIQHTAVVGKKNCYAFLAVQQR